jgi:predicted phage-related endonuclease
MRWGLLHEPAIAEAYLEERGGGYVANQMFCVSRTHPFMCATLDRVHDSGRIVELKSTGERNAGDWGEPGTDEIPQAYQVQVLHQMHCAEIPEADVAVLIGASDFRIYTVRLAGSEPLLAKVIDLEERFMDCVRRRQPPELDVVKDAGLLAYLFPEERGEVAFDDAAAAAWDLYERMGEVMAEARKKRERAKVAVALAMGEAATARLPDGRVLSRKIVSVEERCQVVKAYSFPKFSILKRK